MNRFMASMMGASMAASVLATPVMAQDKTQTVALTQVDVVGLAAGHRASKINGGTVVNEKGDTVGTVDDLIVGDGGSGVYAVLSVGGFLGVGSKYVAVNYNALHITPDKIILPGASKDALQELPAFKYVE